MSVVTGGRQGRQRLLGLVAAGLLAAGCMPASEAVEMAEESLIQIGGENVIQVEWADIMVGPVISGELRALREATVRAELGGPVLEAPLEEGELVDAGSLVVRIAARSLEAARRSAESGVRSAEAGVRSAEAQLALAVLELERTGELVEAGAIAQRDLDVARQAATAAEAQATAAEALVADAQARLAAAEQQLAGAVLRAPFGGIVADKAASVGDVVSPGTAVVTIIDLSTMQLEASVPSERIAEIDVGMPVRFEVRGYAQPFEGRIARISPQVDAATRQAAIFVAIPNTELRLVSGLFAEGRVVERSAHGLVVPENAVNTRGGEAWVLRVQDGRTERVDVTLGLRDPQTERLQIVAGLDAGDTLLRGAAQGIAPGTPVSVGAVAP